MNSKEIIPHLFRTEYRKIVSVLCRHFGLEQIEIAEDIASETFEIAAQNWGIKGLPANPTAWLYTVAKNHVARTNLYTSKIYTHIKSEAGKYQMSDLDLTPHNIIDSQLQMMFAICHPAIKPDAQIGLSLRILCGFGIDEIADAFLTNRETINKRLYRAREKLRSLKINIDIPNSEEIDQRLSHVLTTLYLLFNEGYYSVNSNSTVRKELCYEAIRLCTMLIENANTNKPAVNALLSLMCFHASRFDARVNKYGDYILYHEQDSTLWDIDLISKGVYYLHCSATGEQLTKYHLEATIAYWFTQQDDKPEKWQAVLKLYDQLLNITPSPVVALNRIYVLAKVSGNEQAIKAVEQLPLNKDQFYYTLKGHLYATIDKSEALKNLNKAMGLAKTVTDKKIINTAISQLSV